MANQGGVTNDILKAVGREQGPDYMLKFTPVNTGAPGSGLLDLRDPANTPINSESSITEVLNVVSYLCSTTRNETLIDVANSVAAPNGAAAIGLHTLGPADGTYAAGAGAIADSFIQSANPGGAGSNSLFDITTLQPVGVGTAIIPVSILRRTRQGATANLLWQVQDPHAVGNVGAVTGVMSDCIKQMITILIKTRSIFGPKGWTDLFQKVKGGGSSRSKNAKRTHRHRRRYSSKQY
jgi:hypothetical protein